MLEQQNKNSKWTDRNSVVDWATYSQHTNVPLDKLLAENNNLQFELIVSLSVIHASSNNIYWFVVCQRYKWILKRSAAHHKIIHSLAITTVRIEIIRNILNFNVAYQNSMSKDNYGVYAVQHTMLTDFECEY